MSTKFFPGDLINLTPGAPADERETATVVRHIYKDNFEVRLEDGSTKELILSERTERIYR